MRKRYEFSKGRKNPYAARLKKQITIRLDRPTIDFFKEAAGTSGIPYPVDFASPRVAREDVSIGSVTIPTDPTDGLGLLLVT